MRRLTISLFTAVLLAVCPCIFGLGIGPDYATELGQAKRGLIAEGRWSTGLVRLPTLRFGLSQMGPRTFNPAFARDPQSQLVCGLLSLTLRQAADTLRWQAKAQGGSSLEISLKPCLQWSDGSAVMASDWVDAVREIYTNPGADTIYQGVLAGADTLNWTAINPQTIRIESNTTLNQEAMEKFCLIAPQPMAAWRKWRNLGQAGSLGTGLRSVADNAYFNFVDFSAAQIMSCGQYRVLAYYPGNYVELGEKPGGVIIRLVFYDSLADMQAAFSKGELDILPSLGNQPRVMDYPVLKILAADLGQQVISLIINPKLRASLPWLPGYLAQNLDRDSLTRNITNGLALPCRRIWGRDDLKLNQAASPATKTAIEVLFDQDRPERAMAAKLLGAGLQMHTQASDLDSMAAKLAFGGDWQVMVLSIDEGQDPTSLWRILQVNPPESPGVSPYQTVFPLYRPLALLWCRQDLSKLGEDLEKSFLAYASLLH